MLAWRLPELPRGLRDKLCYEGFPLAVGEIVPPELTGLGSQRRGRRPGWETEQRDLVDPSGGERALRRHGVAALRWQEPVE
jgi:hypothetical protein